MAGGEPIQLVPGSGSRRPVAVVLLIAATLAVGLLKPWGGAGSASVGSASMGRDLPAGATSGAVAALSLPPAAPAGASLDPNRSAGGPCSYGLAWRLFTAEASDLGPVHTWYGLVPVQASGPTDPRIKVVLIHSTTIGQLGYCSLTIPGSTRVVGTQAWRLVPGAGAQALALEPVSSAGSVNPASGAIYAPPSPGISGVWTPAEYVFALRFATNPATEAWFAVDIA